MSEAAAAMLERWQSSNPSDAPLDISQEMMRLTLRIAGLAPLHTISPMRWTGSGARSPRWVP
jgi:hypothetical protein